MKSATQQPVWIITTTDAVERAASHATEWREAGVVLHVVEDETLAPLTILKALAATGLNRVLIEAGAALSTAFLAAQCVDTFYWYRAPILLGNTGNAAISALDVALSSITSADAVESIPLGPDVATVMS